MDYAFIPCKVKQAHFNLNRDLDAGRFGFLIGYNLLFLFYSTMMLVFAIQMMQTSKLIEIRMWQKLTDLFFLIVGTLALILVFTSSFVHRNYFTLKTSAAWSVIVFDLIILFWLILVLLLSHFGWRK